MMKPKPFGLDCPDTPIAWGARAIFTADGGFNPDLLYDRQGWVGDPICRKAFSKALNADLLPKALKRAKDLGIKGEIRGSEGRRVSLTDASGAVQIEANTCGSHGYLYMVAYVPTDPIGGHHESGTPQWSNDKIPEIGDEVRINIPVHLGGRNRDAGVKGTVIGFRVIFGFRYVVLATPYGFGAFPGAEIDV